MPEGLVAVLVIALGALSCIVRACLSDSLIYPTSHEELKILSHTLYNQCRMITVLLKKETHCHNELLPQMAGAS